MASSRRAATGQLQSVWDIQALLAAGVKEQHVIRLMSYLSRHPSGHWSDLADLPKATKQLLDSSFVKFTTRVERCERSADGDTIKLLVSLQDGQQVEAVIMAYDTRVSNGGDAAAAHEARNNHQQLSSYAAEPAPAQQPCEDLNNGTAAQPASRCDGCACTPAADSDDDDYHSAASDDGVNDSSVSHHPGESVVHEGDGPQGTGAAGAGPPSSITGSEAAHAWHGDGHGLQGSSHSQVPAASSYAGSLAGSQAGRAKGPKAVRGAKRATLCVSSQVGCQMGCTFCATGTMGLRGNLTAGEIIEQLVHANAVTRVRNVVFMGMGEPLANYEPVRAAVRLMTNNRLWGLRRSHVTISTVGVIPRIKQLAADLPGVSLALSLHAPNQQLRSTIVPSARAYPLEKLMQAVRQYEEDSKQRVFMEYVMLAGVNDGEEQAHELGRLLQPHNATLNLIPWNPVLAAADAAEEDGARGKAAAPMTFAAPQPESVAAFQAILKSQYRIPTTVRQEKGQDISGACGQLVIQQQQQQQGVGAAGGGGCESKPASPALAGKTAQPAVAVGVRDIEDM